MQAIDKALKDLASQESPNYSATARKYGIDRTTLSRRHRGLARSQAVTGVTRARSSRNTYVPETPTHVRPVTPTHVPRQPLYLDHIS